MLAKNIKSAAAVNNWDEENEFLESYTKEEKEIILKHFDIFSRFEENVIELWFEEAAYERGWIEDIPLPALTREIPRKFKRLKKEDKPYEFMTLKIWYKNDIIVAKTFKKNIVLLSTLTQKQQIYPKCRKPENLVEKWVKRNKILKNEVYAWQAE